MGNLTRITKFKYLALLIMYSFTDCFGQSFPRNDGKIVASLRGTKQSLYLLNNTNFFIVHGGFDFKKPNPFKDFSSMIQLYIDDDNYDTSILKGKKLIHGHKVNELQYIQNKVNEKSQVIPLDNGCAYIKKHKIYDTSKTGILCCLDLESFQLYLQLNIDII